MARYEFFKVGNKTIAYEISFEEALGRDAFAYLITLALFAFLGSILATIVPCLLFIAYLKTEERKSKALINLIIAIICLYFVLDYHFGWLCHLFFTTFFSNGIWYDRFAMLNMGLLISNGILLVHNRINKGKEYKEDGITLDTNNAAIGLMLASVFLCFYLIKNNIPSKYVHVEPPKTEEEKKIEHNQMY